VTVGGRPGPAGLRARLFRGLADRGVNVDMIVQNTSAHGLNRHLLHCPKTDLATSVEVCDALSAELEATGVTSDSDIGRVSLIGAGIEVSPGVTATMFETLAAASINIEMISTSSIRISCVVRDSVVEDAVGALHTAFGLD